MLESRSEDDRPMNSEAERGDGLNRTTLACAAFFAAYLLFQATFAVSCFVYDYGCRLTWTMYAGSLNTTDIVIEWQSGEESLLDQKKGVDGVGRVLGGKVDKARFVPPYLCEHVPGIEAVRVEFRDTGQSERVECSL